MKYVTLIVFLFSLALCSAPERSTFEDQGFKYHVKPAGCYKDLETCEEAYIFELLGENKEREILFFPETIGEGIDNILIGTTTASIVHFKSEHAKIVYINGNQTRIFNDAFANFNGLETVVVNNILNKQIYSSNSNGPYELIIPHEVNDHRIPSYMVKSVTRSRVSYYYNYEGSPNDGLYIIGIEKDDEMIVKPNDPIREGYSFTGWYTETEGIHKFNFNDVNNRKKSELKLYARWE